MVIGWKMATISSSVMPGGNIDSGWRDVMVLG